MLTAGEGFAGTAKADLVGLVLAGALAVWALLVAGWHGGSPRGLVTVLGIGAGALVIGRLLAEVDPRLPALVVVVVGLVLLVVDSGLAQVGPRQGPFDYANATGAMYAQVGAAAFVLAALAGRVAGRVLWGSLGVAALALLVHLFTTGATMTAGLAGVGVLLGWWRRWPTPVLARFGLAAVAAAHLLAVVAGVVGYVPARGRRAQLWGDALAQLAEDPLHGVGPGRFSAVSPTALADGDPLHAHNELLEAGAELGVVGLVLAAAIAVWWIRRAGSATSVAAPIGLAAVLGLWGHAAIDYPLHFPGVVAAAVLVLCAATARGSGGSESG